MSALRSYRDDGPLVELLAGRRAPGRTGLGWTCGALLPLLALLLVPLTQATQAQTAGALLTATLLAAVLNGAACRSPHLGRLDWLVPPLLRAAEYGALLGLAVLSGPATVPACYALLAAIAYHHYDVVYRLRDRGEQPSTSVRRAGLGWDGRLVAAGLLTALDVLGPALYAGATVLLVLYVTESARAWRRAQPA